MKRKNLNLKSFITYDNIYGIYKEVKNNCENEEMLLKFNINLSQNLCSIVNDLYFGKYKFSGYNIFLLHENKYRIIMSENISDKIVSLFLTKYILLPAVDSSLIEQNVTTRVGKGSKEAYNYIEKYLRKIGLDKKIYALKMDLSKYFYTIDHEILKEKLKRKVKDELALKYFFDMIDLTNEDYVNKKIISIKDKEKNFIDKLNISDKEKNNLKNEIDKIPFYEYNKGLSIGSVVNQTNAVMYTDSIDKFIKEELKIKYYIRYMDDMILLSEDKKYLKYCFSEIKKKVGELKLIVNPKSNIYLVNNSLTFLGCTYSIKNGILCKRIKSNTFNKINKKLKYMREKDFESYYLSKASYKGLVGLTLISLEDESEYLIKKYNVTVLNRERIFFLSSEVKDIWDNLKNKNCNSLIKYLLKKNIRYIFLEENKCEFNLVS